MTESQIEPTKTVDARGAACPGPLMDLIGTVRDVDPGDVVLLLSDSDSSLTDVPEWVEKAGNELRAVDEGEDHHELYVEKV
ncbi:sulfurtransferase TusA family protein [Halohasta salina]|uniref:sulfurtransferase TusA family protein n=1 Tax=Halohasta salina TaxID=2961621 RepID=UPI0020A2D006|nr:sulfurtransferase TusA family protein [Halohasta salina]